MANIPALDRLKSQLQMTGLQQKNFPLYQIISQLIDFLRQGIDTSAAGLANVSAAISAATPSSSSTTQIILGTPFSTDGIDGLDGEFSYKDFRNSVAKFVRKDHVAPSAHHWFGRTVVPNQLKV